MRLVKNRIGDFLIKGATMATFSYLITNFDMNGIINVKTNKDMVAVISRSIYYKSFFLKYSIAISDRNPQRLMPMARANDEELL